MAVKTEADVIRRNGGAHIALLIMKMKRGAVTLEEFTEISAKKLAVRHRRDYIERLVKYGYATKESDNPLTVRITQQGLDKIIELTVPKTRKR